MPQMHRIIFVNIIRICNSELANFSNLLTFADLIDLVKEMIAHSSCNLGVK